MSIESFEGWLSPSSSAKEFLQATTRVEELELALLHQKLGDKVAQEATESVETDLTRANAASEQEILAGMVEEETTLEERIIATTFSFMEDGTASDPYKAEKLARDQHFFNFLNRQMREEHDLNYSQAIAEINKLVEHSFGQQGITIPPSQFTWYLDPIRGIFRNSVPLITQAGKTGIAMHLQAEDDKISKVFYWSYPNVLHSMTTRPQGDPSSYFSRKDFETLPIVSEEVLRRIQRNVIPALEASLDP